jgi:hypothetical protein
VVSDRPANDSARPAVDDRCVELVAQSAPGVAGGGLGDADEQQREPAQHDVRADAVFEAVVDGAQFEGGLHVAPAAFDFEELLAAKGDVFDRQGRIGAAEQELAVESFFGRHDGTIDAQQSARSGAQEPAQPGGQGAGELGVGFGVPPLSFSPRMEFPPERWRERRDLRLRLTGAQRATVRVGTDDPTGSVTAKAEPRGVTVYVGRGLEPLLSPAIPRGSW